MITPKTHASVRLVCLLWEILLVPAGLSTVAGAETEATIDTTVSAADMEHLAQQIADPEQWDQLLKTLQALILAAKPGDAGVPLQGTPDLAADQAQGLFFAFGELTEHMATSGRRIIHGLVTIPLMLAELPRRLQDLVMLWSVTSFVLAAFSLVIAGFGLKLVTSRQHHHTAILRRHDAPTCGFPVQI